MDARVSPLRIFLHLSYVEYEKKAASYVTYFQNYETKKMSPLTTEKQHKFLSCSGFFLDLPVKLFVSTYYHYSPSLFLSHSISTSIDLLKFSRKIGVIRRETNILTLEIGGKGRKVTK